MQRLSAPTCPGKAVGMATEREVHFQFCFLMTGNRSIATIVLPAIIFSSCPYFFAINSNIAFVRGSSRWVAISLMIV